VRGGRSGKNWNGELKSIKQPETATKSGVQEGKGKNRTISGIKFWGTSAFEDRRVNRNFIKKTHRPKPKRRGRYHGESLNSLGGGGKGKCEKIMETGAKRRTARTRGKLSGFYFIILRLFPQKGGKRTIQTKKKFRRGSETNQRCKKTTRGPLRPHQERGGGGGNPTIWDILGEEGSLGKR